MNKLYKTKQIFIIILILVIVGAIILSATSKKEAVVTESNTSESELEKDLIKQGSFCYYRSDKAESGFYDIAWIKLNIAGNIATGEFRHLPAESDSKVGTFKGEAETIDQTPMNTRANVWWDSQAEGMEVKEELEIIFNEESATVGFGEMTDRGDGVYVYKDKTNLFYPKPMNKIDCDIMNEKLSVEKYLRDNIEKIAPNKAVLGGTWYVVSATINPAAKTGEIEYEDGHIQSKASLTYKYAKESDAVTITKIEVK